MNKTDILESMYEIIKDSTEWAIGGEDREYIYFVDGVMSMTDMMLAKLELKEANMMNKLENFITCNEIANG